MDGQLVVVRIVDKTDRMPKFHSLHLRIGPHKHVNKFADKNSGKNLENVIVSTDSYCMVLWREYMAHKAQRAVA